MLAPEKLSRNALAMHLLIVVFMFSSCNAIFAPSKQQVVIETGEATAKIAQRDKEIGTGKSIQLDLSKKVCEQFVVSAPGYKTEYYALCITPQKYPLYYAFLVPDVASLFIGYGISKSVPYKTHLYAPTNKFAPKQKLYRKAANEKYIDVEMVKMDFKSYFSQRTNFDLVIGKQTFESAIKAYDEKGNKSTQSTTTFNSNILSFLKGITITTESTYDKGLISTLIEEGYLDTLSNLVPTNNNTVLIGANIDQAQLIKVYPIKAVKGKAASYYYKARLNVL